jgi:CheY-like chemotaxis protein
LVDDHDVVRRTLATLLKQAGFDVHVAKDGIDALEQLGSGKLPSAIVSDILMPRMSGIQLARTLADRRSRVPIVLLTGYAELQSEEAASLPAKVPILRKPTTAATLTMAVRNAIDGSRGAAVEKTEALSVSSGLPS